MALTHKFLLLHVNLPLCPFEKKRMLPVTDTIRIVGSGDRNACKFYFILVSSYYGFGLMDAHKMVQYAKKWTSVSEQMTCEVYLNILRLVIMAC